MHQRCTRLRHSFVYICHFHFMLFSVFIIQSPYTFTHAYIWTHTHTHTCTIRAHKEKWQEPSTCLEGVQAGIRLETKAEHIHTHAWRKNIKWRGMTWCVIHTWPYTESVRVRMCMCLCIYEQILFVFVPLKGLQLADEGLLLEIHPGHGLGGLAPHQCRCVGIVWVVRCRDGVMGCCGVWLFCVNPSFFRDQPNDASSDWASCVTVLAYWGSAAPLLSL